jgi:hypothetical protein
MTEEKIPAFWGYCTDCDWETEMPNTACSGRCPKCKGELGWWVEPDESVTTFPWPHYFREMGRLGIKNFDGLNPGIRATVLWLMSSGLTTLDSGDGQTGEYACDRPYPYVVALCEPTELFHRTSDLKRELMDMGHRVHPVNPNGDLCIEGQYDPVDDVGTLQLMGATDAKLWPPKPET